jgi:hypothetical protein
VFDVAFSRDPQQTYLYIADGSNMKVRILKCDTREELTSFGDGGRQPGQFYAVHSIATDAKATSTRPRRMKESACTVSCIAV